MENQIKFTDEEVQQINQLRNDLELVFIQLGQVSVERKRRNDEIDAIEVEILEKHKEIVKKEEEIFKALNEKYGDGNYDPTTGIFTPITNQVG
jgi:uncharacterized protein YecA (UPF0149 family)